MGDAGDGYRAGRLKCIETELAGLLRERDAIISTAAPPGGVSPPLPFGGPLPAATDTMPEAMLVNVLGDIAASYARKGCLKIHHMHQADGRIWKRINRITDNGSGDNDRAWDQIVLIARAAGRPVKMGSDGLYIATEAPELHKRALADTIRRYIAEGKVAVKPHEERVTSLAITPVEGAEPAWDLIEKGARRAGFTIDAVWGCDDAVPMIIMDLAQRPNPDKAVQAATFNSVLDAAAAAAKPAAKRLRTADAGH